MNAVQGGQVACGKTSTFHLGTPVSLSWRPCSDRMWKLILLLFKMVLFMTRSLLRCCCRPEFSSCLKEEKAPFIVLHYPSSLITSTNIKLPSSTPEWGYGLLFVWFLVVNYIKMNRIVALLVLVFKTRIPQIPQMYKFIEITKCHTLFFKSLGIGKSFISICIGKVDLKCFKNYFSWWSFHLRDIVKWR